MNEERLEFPEGEWYDHAAGECGPEVLQSRIDLFKELKEAKACIKVVDMDADGHQPCLELEIADGERKIYLQWFACGEVLYPMLEEGKNFWDAALAALEFYL